MAGNNNEGSPLLWLWIVVAVIGIVAVSMLVARRSVRRPVMSTGWHTKLVDAYAKGSALYDSMSVAESPGGPATGEEATDRWAGIQRRADDLTQDLCDLRETAPNEMERLHVSDVLASLKAVRSALDTERRAGDPGGAGDSRACRDEQVHDLLLSFETSLRALRLTPGGADSRPSAKPTFGRQLNAAVNAHSVTYLTAHVGGWDQCYRCD